MQTTTRTRSQGLNIHGIFDAWRAHRDYQLETHPQGKHHVQHNIKKTLESQAHCFNHFNLELCFNSKFHDHNFEFKNQDSLFLVIFPFSRAINFWGSIHFFPLTFPPFSPFPLYSFSTLPPLFNSKIGNFNFFKFGIPYRWFFKFFPISCLVFFTGALKIIFPSLSLKFLISNHSPYLISNFMVRYLLSLLFKVEVGDA